MTQITRKMSLLEIEELTVEGKREIAAARAEVRVSNLLKKAFRLSNMTQANLAKWIGVTEGRVSQVLGSDGNLRITTISRYLRAMGYELVIDAKPVDLGTPNLNVVRNRKIATSSVRIYVDESAVAAGNNNLIFSSEAITGINLDQLQYKGSVNIPVKRNRWILETPQVDNLVNNSLILETGKQ